MKVVQVVCGTCYNVFVTKEPFEDKQKATCPVCKKSVTAHVLRLVCVVNTNEQYWMISEEDYK